MGNTFRAYAILGRPNGSEASPQSSTAVAALLTAVAASLVLAFLFLLNRIDPQPGGPGEQPTTAKKLSREETLKLLDQRDRAVALLENHEFAKADE